MYRTAPKTKAPVTLGVHHVLELYGCPAALLDDALIVSDAMEHAAATSETKLLDKLVHHFPAQGVTALALLAESHIAIHTWPELGYAAVDRRSRGAKFITRGEHRERRFGEWRHVPATGLMSR